MSNNLLDIVKNEKKFYFQTLFVEITNQCNLNCKHCYNSSSKNSRAKLSIQVYKKIIREFSKRNVTNIVLSGGEALLHQDFWIMLEITKNWCYNITLLTNGKLLTNEVVDRLRFFDVKIQLSLDGANENTHDYIRSKGSYRDVITALEIISKKNYQNNASINTVIMEANCNELSKIVEIAKKYKIHNIGFNFLNEIGRAKGNTLACTCSLFNAIEQINKIKRSDEVKINEVGVTSNCRFCDNSDILILNPVIDVYGNIYMCEYMREPIFSIGNIKKGTLDDILSDDKIKELLLLLNIRRNYITRCRTCVAKEACKGGCIVHIENDNIFLPAFCDEIKQQYLKKLGSEAIW